MGSKAILVSLATLLVVGCVPKSELEASQKQLAELQSLVHSLQQENAELKAVLARKPELPVSLSLRKAMMGPGYVAIFDTTVKAPITVLATLKSAALGTSKQFELRLDPRVPKELGHLEGATIEDGDTISLENNNYQTVVFTVKP